MFNIQKNKLVLINQKGSTLIGVALLTLVMGFLMSGGIYLLNTYDAVQTDIQSSEKTADLQKALKNFVGIHKRYPCPAPINVAPDEPGFGIENCGASSGIADVSGRDGLGVKIGAAPVRTLNVPDSLIVDGFGRRHIYAVTTEMTNAATADVVNGLGAITIMHELDGHKETLSDIEGYVVYTLISPGSDDRGAYDINGKEILPCELGTIAGHNCDMSDATFYTTIAKSLGDSTDFTHNFAFAANSPSYYWYTGQWSECANRYTAGNPSYTQAEWNGSASFFGNNAVSPECFSSFQEREVVCRDKQGNDVAASYCNHTDEPIDYRTCSIDECEWGVEQPSCPSTIGGCGNGLMVDYNHICLDYKDRKTGLSVCDSYISRIGSRPMPLPRRNCPQVCCIQTHYVDGVADSTTPKVAGTCNDTYETTPDDTTPTVDAGCTDQTACTLFDPRVLGNYEAMFGRPADAEGALYWTNEKHRLISQEGMTESEADATIEEWMLNAAIENGENIISISNSDNLTITDMPTSTMYDDRVLGNYQAMFGRDADGEGAMYWTNEKHRLMSQEGLTEAQANIRLDEMMLAAAIENGENIISTTGSSEVTGDIPTNVDAVTNQVYDIFEQHLGRVPDGQGGIYWTNRYHTLRSSEGMSESEALQRLEEEIIQGAIDNGEL